MTYSIRVPYTEASIRQIYRSSWLNGYLIPYGYWLAAPFFALLFIVVGAAHPWEGTTALFSGFLLGVIATLLLFLVRSFSQTQKAMRSFLETHQNEALEIVFSEQWVEMSSRTNKRGLLWSAVYWTLDKQSWTLSSSNGQVIIPKDLISEELQAFILNQMAPYRSAHRTE